MKSANSANHGLYAVAEATYAVTPDDPAFTLIRNTACTLGLSKGGNESEEMDPSRMVNEFRHGNRQVGGDIGFELSYGSFDMLLLGALAATGWVRKLNFAAVLTISAASADGSFNDSASGFPLLHVGDVITVSGFTTAGNNGRFKVVTATSAKITVTKADGTAHGLTVEAAGDEVTMVSDAYQAKAASTVHSYTFLRHFSDIEEAEKPYHAFTGVMVDKMSLSVVASGAPIKGSFSLVGKNLSLATVLTAFGNDTALGAASTTRVFDGFTGSLQEGGSTLGFATEIQLTTENGLEPQFVLFSSTTELPSMDRFRVSGTINAHFRTSALLEKFLNETSSSLVFDLIDLAGNTYRFRVPRVTLNGGKPDTTAKGTIILQIPFVGLKDAASGSSFMIERIPVQA
jgi:hypothetical protein